MQRLVDCKCKRISDTVYVVTDHYETTQQVSVPLFNGVNQGKPVAAKKTKTMTRKIGETRQRTFATEKEANAYVDAQELKIQEQR